VSQVNLLPPEILETQKWRRLTIVVFAVGGIVAAILIAFYLLQVTTLSGVRADIEDRNATNESINQQIAEKQKFAALQAEAQAQEAKLALAYQGEVSFSALLMDTSRVVPSDAYLDSLSIQITDPAAAATATDTTTTTGLVGAITGSGKAVSIDTLSTFLTRLESVKGWVNPFINTIGLDPETGGYQYAYAVDLTDEVVTPRGKGADVQG
jgi:Tfp pilus assembly protein PilN